LIQTTEGQPIVGAKYSVLLINSPLFRDSVAATDEDYLPSLGLGMLAGAATRAGIAVQYIDAIFEKRSVPDIIETIDNNGCDAVALNIFTVNQHLVREIVERVRRPVMFILGGLSTRALFSSIAKWNSSNDVHVVFGDGENIFPTIVKAPSGVKCDKVDGRIRYYEVNTSSRYYASDISGIYPDRSIYLNEPYHNVHGIKEACIVTSRGCIYNCAFCAAARSANQDLSVREASVASVRAEITSIVQKYLGIESIRVLDDLYLKNRESILRATETFADYPLTWRAMAHVASIKQVSDGDLRQLRASGCSELFVGVESGSPSVLRRIHKTADVGLIREQMARLFASDIGAKCYFIFGFPGETDKDMAQSLELAQKMHDDAISAHASFRTSVFQFRPYHGTELFHAAQGADAAPEKDARFDSELTERIGRPQYNFESGNYSSVGDDDLRTFITNTAKLSVTRSV
jgi:anaerobic magnesium-protoporphyrin IX monomethyl ester cyclase